MSATHKRARVSVALDGRRLLCLVAVVFVFSVFGLGTSAAAPSPGGWVASTYTSSDLERVVGVEFWTPDRPVSYTVRVFSGLQDGRPEGLLFEQKGRAGECGYYSVPVAQDIFLAKGQTCFVAVGFKAIQGETELPQATPCETPSTGGMASRDGVTFHPATFAEAPVALLTVPDNGRTEAVAISKFVVSAPIPPLPIVAGSPMTFKYSATGTAVGHALNITIQFGDGTADFTATGIPSPIVDRTQDHTYATAGRYKAKLTITDSVDSTTLSKELDVVVDIPVVTTSTETCGLVPLNVCFTATPSNGTPPYSYAWNFGDGSAVSHEQNPCHAFVTAGAFSVSLTVTDAAGATGKATPLLLDVIKPLTVVATSNVTDGIPVTLVNFCVVASNGLPPYTYSWDFGDGMAAADVLCPQHAYATVGVYDAEVTVDDSCGQTVSQSITITVHQPPWVRIISPVSSPPVLHAQVNLAASVMVEPGVTVSRVEYYVNGYYLGYSTVAPYSVIWDSRGVNGEFELTAQAYDSMGRSNFTEDPPVIITIANPTLDGRVEALTDPFRLRVFGNYFQAGCKIRINNVLVPATSVKSSTMAVAKGGASLKAMVPKGVPVIVSVTNPDGGISLESTFVR